MGIVVVFGIRYWYSVRGRTETTSVMRVQASTTRPSGPLDRAAKRDAQMRLKALCFGDFHLGQQMKVTRLPGRDPAAWGYSKATIQSPHWDVTPLELDF